jgi:hypothetical protein
MKLSWFDGLMVWRSMKFIVWIGSFFLILFFVSKIELLYLLRETRETIFSVSQNGLFFVLFAWLLIGVLLLLGEE